MSYEAKVMNLMVASPSDLTRERNLAVEVIARWNRLHSEHFKLVLMPLLWESDSVPSLGDRPQSLINRQLVERADMLIGIFWTRLGTPTGMDPSGTAEEIREMEAKGKPVMIYKSDVPVRPDSIDQTQYEALQKFLAETQKKGLLHTYSLPEEFANKLYDHLAMSMPKHAPIPHADAPSSLATDFPRVANVEISAEAATILLLASDYGEILIVRTFGGTHIQAGRKTVNKLNDRRSEAKWERAVNDLAALGLLRDRGYKGELFEITHSGYETIDQLKQRGIQPIELDSKDD